MPNGTYERIKKFYDTLPLSWLFYFKRRCTCFNFHFVPTATIKPLTDGNSIHDKTAQWWQAPFSRLPCFALRRLSIPGHCARLPRWRSESVSIYPDTMPSLSKKTITRQRGGWSCHCDAKLQMQPHQRRYVQSFSCLRNNLWRKRQQK